MLCTVSGSNSARGKKNRRNMKKLAAMYAHTAVQIILRRNRLGSTFAGAFAAAAAGAAGRAVGDFGAACGVSVTVPAAGGLAPAGRASSGFAIRLTSSVC